MWLNERGQHHREDGPSFMDSNGYEVWYINNKRHRLDGPAVIDEDGHQEWWINGINITPKVIMWISENNFPEWIFWTDTHKIMFRLAFSGITS